MNSIVIIGLGLMGGSVAKALKNKNPDISISAFDPVSYTHLTLPTNREV